MEISPPSSLRAFRRSLTFLRWAFMFFVIYALIVAGASLLSGRGYFYVNGAVDDSTVELGDVRGNEALISTSGAKDFLGELSAPGEVTYTKLDESPLHDVRVEGVNIGHKVDRTLLVLMVVWAALTLTAVWKIIVNLEKFATAAVAGDHFNNENTRRLGAVGNALVALAALTLLSSFVINQTVAGARDEYVSGFRADYDLTIAVVLFLAGLLVAGFARAFDWGFQLQEFEQATI